MAKTRNKSPYDQTKQTYSYGSSGSYAIGGTIGMFGIGGMSSIDGWFTTDNRLQVGIQLFKTEGDSSESTDDDETSVVATKEYIDLKNRGIKFYGRLFPGSGSFYITGGIGIGKTAGNYGVENRAVFSKVTTAYDGSYSFLQFAIGNQWRWDSGVIIGCDWIAVNSLAAKLDVDQNSGSAQAINTFTNLDTTSRPVKVFEDAHKLSVLNLNVSFRL